MRRRIPGLSKAANSEDEIPDGLYLVRVERVQYRWQKQKPFYSLQLSVVEPKQFASASLCGRLYCTPRVLWKLSWFLRDFGYDPELLGRDELDEKALVGLTGVVKISHSTVHGRALLNFQAFAPAASWNEFSIQRYIPDDTEVA